jgi:hypothetical protein
MQAPPALERCCLLLTVTSLPMKRPQQLALIFGLIIFGLGVASGILGHRLYDTGAVNAADDWRTRYVNEMQVRLNLTPLQVDQLNDVLDDTRVKVRAVKDKYKPQMLDIKQQQIAAMKALLSPKQQTEYDKFLADKEEKAKQQDARERQLEEQRTAERRLREQHEQDSGR